MRMVRMDDEDEAKAFAIRAAKEFEKNDKLCTYTDKPIEAGCLFAVRWGLLDNCVLVFKLDEEFEPTNYQGLIKQQREE